MPSMLTSVAFVVCHVSVVDIPLSTLFGFAEIEAVGEGGGGGGGGGGGAAFFLQAPNVIMAPRMNTRVIHFIFGYFTFSSCGACTRGSYARLKPASRANISAIAG